MSSPPRLVTAITAAAFAATAWRAVNLGPVRFSDLLLVIALVAAVVAVPSRTHFGTLYMPGPARRYLLGLTLMTVGIALGEIRHLGWGVEVREIVLVGFLASLPTVIVLRLRPSPALIGTLIKAFVAGVLVSVAFAAVGEGVTDQGRWLGLTYHKNQLMMTIVLALPLVQLTFRRRGARAGCYAVLLIGLNQGDSRSGLVGAAVVAILLLVAQLKSRRWVGIGFAALVLVPAGIWLNGVGSATEGAGTSLSRWSGSESAQSSDEARSGLLQSGLAEFNLDVAIVGRGYSYLVPSPHNSFLEVLIAGGILSAVGAVLVFAPPLRAALRGAWRPRTVEPLSFRLAVSVVGYMAIIAINNALWAPYAWTILGLFVTAGLAQRPSSLGSDRNVKRRLVCEGPVAMGSGS